MIRTRQHDRAMRSLPVRGAWIETVMRSTLATSQWSLPVRGAWIETIVIDSRTPVYIVSLPVRGAWIETAVDLAERSLS